MGITPVIADLSRKELFVLKASKGGATKNADLDRFAKEFADLTDHRRFAFVHFQELSGLKDQVGRDRTLPNRKF